MCICGAGVQDISLATSMVATLVKVLELLKAMKLNFWFLVPIKTLHTPVPYIMHVCQLILC